MLVSNVVFGLVNKSLMESILFVVAVLLLINWREKEAPTLEESKFGDAKRFFTTRYCAGRSRGGNTLQVVRARNGEYKWILCFRSWSNEFKLKLS